jgi:hypothetical protein
MLDWSGVWRLSTALVGCRDVWKRGGEIDDLSLCIYKIDALSGTRVSRLGQKTKEKSEIHV